MAQTSTTNPEVLDPASLGLDPEKVEALVARARREVEEGLLPSCQLALARDGQLALFETLGSATNDNRYVVFSCTKALMAGAAWLLIGEGDLSPDTVVADLVPEFGSNGKEVVTLENLLTHTAGFPNAPLGPPEWFTREGRLERFGRWRLEFEPGSRYWYHPTAAHWVVGELIERVTGGDYRTFVNQRVLDALGLSRFRLGVAEGDQGDVTTLEIRGEPATPDELQAVLGVREMPATEVTDEALVGFNDPAVRALGVPGGGGITTAADLALYYQALLDDPAGLWDAPTRRDGTSVVRVTMPDPFLGVPGNRTLGLIVSGDDGKSHLRGFGRTVSSTAFGHGGAAGQIAWADPATGLSFSYVTNGIDQNVLRQARRGVALSSLAGVCVADDRR